MTQAKKTLRKKDIIPLLKQASKLYRQMLTTEVLTPLSELRLKRLQQTIKSFITET